MIYDFGFMISDLWNSERGMRQNHCAAPKSNYKSAIINHKFCRRGVTLMEVLISAGVTAVGLFGVLALVPLAAVQVGKGVQEDRKATVAKTAIAEFRTR